MNFFRFILILMVLFRNISSAQNTGLLEDFNDNTLTGWEVPGQQTAGTFALTEADSILRIDYNRNIQSYEWDNFNFTPALIINATSHPYITVRARSNIGTVLTFKPIYENGESDWLQVTLPSDDIWYTYKFELLALEPYEINRIYMYLDGGSTEPRSGVVYFDDLRIGDSVRTVDILDVSALERLIREANALYDYSVEGAEEGQFEPGSKAILRAAITSAEEILENPDISNDIIDSTVWRLADACVTFESSVIAADIGLIDPLATKQTKYLYINLDELAESFLLFGMHDATGYGVGWTGDDERSDVKDVCGSYPAIYSEDMNKVDRDREVDRMRYRLTSAYNRGGVITICWHQYDPQGRSFYSENVNYENIVATLLPGGQYHQFYRDRLYKIAKFLKTLRAANGESIPVIFRPYHEHTGGWFWWGAGQCSVDQYNAIWKFTVEYLRDSLNVHNLIYAISPSAQHISSTEDYFNIYPGDDYVDIFGLDNYFGNPITSAENAEFKNDLRRIVQNANDKGKIAALTEVGQENIPTSNLFTQYILEPVLTDSLTRRISYAAVWRNESTSHHFAPYPGHPSVPDFIKFYEDPYTLFEDNLPDMYALNSMDQIPPEIISYPDEVFTAFYSAVTIEVKTNERAFIRYSFSDQIYADMPFEFQKGQGGFDHSTIIEGQQGDYYHMFIRAADYNNNVMNEAVEVIFTIDTLQRPVNWTEKDYDISDWQEGMAPFHFENGSENGTSLPYSRTVYFHKPFTVADAEALFQMVAFIQYDNGFVLYLNGHEVRRVNMPAGQLSYETWAGNSTQSTINVTLDASVLEFLSDGQNVIAVEVHQSENDSSDLRFDLKLIDPDIVIDYGEAWSAYAQGQVPPRKTIGGTGMDVQLLSLPEKIALFQNYPNPFNPRTAIGYQVGASANTAVFVDLSLYNLIGQKVATLVYEKQRAGTYQVEWDASFFSSGIYYCRLKANDFVETRKMILIR